MPHEEAKAGLRSQSTHGIQSQVKAGVVESLLSITTPKHTVGTETCLFRLIPQGKTSQNRKHCFLLGKWEFC